MSALLDVDEIDDIAEMIETMVILKIPIKGLCSFEQMRAKVKETLQSLDKNSSWTAKVINK